MRQFCPARSIPCAVMFLMTISGQATSAPLSYDESVSGDISPYHPNDPLFVFDIGLNTITGTAFASSAGSSDFDNFGFVVPNGSVLTTIIYEFSNVTTSGTGNINTRYGFYEGSVVNDVFAQPVTPVSDTSPITFSLASLPLSSGIYNTNQTFGFLSGSAAGTASWDYKMTFNVRAVPLPATAWLFGSGLLGIIGVTRRKQAA